jgi:hypothetical protein
MKLSTKIGTPTIIFTFVGLILGFEVQMNGFKFKTQLFGLVSILLE